MAGQVDDLQRLMHLLSEPNQPKKVPQQPPRPLKSFLPVHPVTPLATSHLGRILQLINQDALNNLGSEKQ